MPDQGPGVSPFNLSTKSVLNHFPFPNSATIPSRVALGSDKNVWFNELNYNKIGKMTETGAVSEFTLPSGHFGADIAPGKTGTLWFTEFGSGFIGKITTGGTVTEFPTPPNAFTVGITLGPDGNMWFCDSNNDAIGKITPTGHITEFTLPKASENPIDIVAGPDGNLWFADPGFGLVGKMTTTGAVTEFSGPGDDPFAITAGADGKLYAAAGHGIWQITTAGVINEFTTSDIGWENITLGPDKQLWMTSPGFGALVEFNPKTSKFSATITPDIVNGSAGEVTGLTVGSDGDVWILGPTGNDMVVYEEKVFTIGVRLNGEMSFNDPNYGFELGYAVGTGTQTQTVLLTAGESVQFQNLDTIQHSAAFLGDATSSSAPWPGSFNGSTTQAAAGTAIGTPGFATGPINPAKKSLVYETGMPGFYMFGCQFHYNSREMRTVIVVH